MPDGAQINGITGAQLLERIRGHHATRLAVVVAPPGVLGRNQLHTRRAGDRLKHVQGGRGDFAPDTVARNDRNVQRGHGHIPFGVKRPSAASQPPSAKMTVPVM